jgi:CheY-like chemotaxis protein
VKAGQYVLIAVTDTGTGMSSEALECAFEPFYTTKPVGKGTGLGLAQVFGFIKQSAGHVKIYSEPCRGTTVKLYLPRFVGQAAREKSAIAIGMPTGKTDETVLVVEDDVKVRQLSTMALRELGYTVLEADNAASALELIDVHPEIALLFTDVVMPDIDGRKLADEARRRKPALKVLYTTGYTRNAIIHNGVLDEGVHFLAKPISLEELARKVRFVLDHGD